LTTGACVELQGSLIASPGKEQNKELQVSKVKVLGECDNVSSSIIKMVHGIYD
jgi:asparaginyl-tRNA synthetase